MTYGNGQGQPGKEPVDRVVDLFVHTPIGLAVMAWKRLPELVGSVPELVGQAVAKGCAQLSEAEAKLSEEVRKARTIGQVAVTFGGRQLRREVDARLRDARQAAGGVTAFLPGAGSNGGPDGAGARGATPVSTAETPTEPSSAGEPPAAAARARTGPAARKATKTTAGGTKTTGARRPTPETAAGRAAKTTGAGKTTKTAAAGRAAKTTGAGKTAKTTAARKATKATVAKKPAGPAPASAAELPIREYDGLSASQVVSRLSGLGPEELRAVRVYEEQNRGRRTVLVAVDRLL